MVAQSLIQLEVASFSRDQLIVCALLGDAAVLEHDYTPGLADRGETMGDHDRGAPGEQAAHGSFDAALRVQVDVGCGLVEDQDAWVGDQCPREGDQLTLAGGELCAALADFGVVSRAATRR